jgi:hypothetical protein
MKHLTAGPFELTEQLGGHVGANGYLRVPGEPELRVDQQIDSTR